MLQQFLVSLHLALHHHVGENGVEHVHSDARHRVEDHGHGHSHGQGHGQGHGHGHGQAGGSDDVHESHPEEDHHLEQLAVPGVLPTSVHVVAALLAERADPLSFVAERANEQPRYETLAPRPPPRRAAAPPRAPPVVS